MQQPLQITFHGIEQSEAVERRIRARAAELEQFSDDITSCHVTVESPHRRHRQGNLYRVRVDIRLPDEEVGDEVRFVIAEGEKGPQASAVIPVGKHHILGEASA